MFRKFLLFCLISLAASCGNAFKDNGETAGAMKSIDAAEAALKEKKPEKAVEFFNKALEVVEKYQKEDKESLFRIHLGLGRSYFDLPIHNNIHFSLKHIKKAYSLKPEDGRALFCMGAVFQELGKDASDLKLNEKALSYLEKAAKVLSDSANVLLKLGIAYNRVGKNEEGLEAIKRARDIDPKSPIIKMHLGAAYCLCKKYAEAEAEYLGILEINPEFSKVHFNLGWLYLNAEDEKFKNVDEALRYGEIALVQEPKAIYNYELLADVYDVKGEYKKAFEICEDAVKLGPDNLAWFQQKMINLEARMKKAEDKKKKSPEEK